jgi:YD repeat-containing protein
MRAPVKFSWFCVLLICGYQTADSAHSPTQTSKFEYDNLGRLAQMRRTLSTGGSELYVYAYDAAGKISSIRYMGGDLLPPQSKR